MTAIPFDTLEVRAERGTSIRARWVVGALLGFALLPRVGFLARPFESDSGLYIYMGKMVAEGGVIYRDFYETKPPGVPLFCAGLYALFGHAWWPYVMLQAGMTVLGAWLLGQGVGQFRGRGGRLAAMLFAGVFLNFSPVAYRGFQLETVQCFFACVGGYFAMRVIAGEGRAWRACFLAGLFAGLAAMLKPTGMAVAGALLVSMALSRRHFLGRAGMVVVGLIVPALGVGAWVWRAGLVGEMPGLFREIALYGSGTPLVTLDWIKPVMVMVVGGFPFLGAWICGSNRNFESGERGPRAGRLNGVLLFAVVWLMLEAIGVVLQKRMYIYHFLTIVPPLAVLFGMAFANRALRSIGVALAPIVLLSLLRSHGDFRTLLRGNPVKPESAWLLAHAKPQDRVVGDPIERLLMETRLTCGARYAHLFYFANHDAAPLEYGARFLDDIARNKPQWAVFLTDREKNRQIACELQAMFRKRPERRENLLRAWEQIEEVLERDYEESARAGDFTIYRRKTQG